MAAKASLIAAASAACVLAACGGGSDIGHVDASRAGGPTIVITAAQRCPGSLGRAAEVDNAPDGLSERLLPKGSTPTSGLVCEYRGSASSRQRPLTHLAVSARLDAQEARRLATAISRISLKAPDGAFSCPADVFGSSAVIALDYADRAVDLWYHQSGCQTLDNGHVIAFEGANPSFYSGFRPVFDDVAPPPKR